MYSIIQPLHSYLAWLLLVLIVLTLVFAVMGQYNPVQAASRSFRSAKVAFILTHTQFLLGIILYFISPYGFKNLSSETMHDSIGRLIAVEHPMINVIAVILITFGYLKLKRSLTMDGTKTVLIYYGIGLILLLSRIPYHNWLN